MGSTKSDFKHCQSVISIRINIANIETWPFVLTVNVPRDCLVTELQQYLVETWTALQQQYYG